MMVAHPLPQPSRNYRKHAKEQPSRNRDVTERNCCATVFETTPRNCATIPLRGGKTVSPLARAFHRGTGCAALTLRSAGPLLSIEDRP